MIAALQQLADLLCGRGERGYQLARDFAPTVPLK
jgi:hypothetical protein